MIFNTKIKFNRSKQQPLLPNTILMQPNKFKSFCIEFINHFNIKWNKDNILPSKINKKYQKDAQRSAKICESFIKCLYQIRELLLKSNVQYPLFSTKVSSVPFLNEMNTEIEHQNEWQSNDINNALYQLTLNNSVVCNILLIF